MAKTKIISVKVDPELWAKVRAKADEKHVNISALLRSALAKWADT
jgi:post-segregation antitoxin (ccd killing protein)